MNEKRYRAVLFDLGGTLRIALEDEPYMRHARRKMTELAGAPLQVEDFYQLVEDRYESYRRWALGENKEAGDRELWCRWLLPEYPDPDSHSDFRPHAYLPPGFDCLRGNFLGQEG